MDSRGAVGLVDRAWCHSVFSQVSWDAEAETELLVFCFFFFWFCFLRLRFSDMGFLGKAMITPEEE